MFCLALAILIAIIIESFLHADLAGPHKPVWKSFGLNDKMSADASKKTQNKP